MEGRSVCLLSIWDLASYPLERLVLPTAFTLTGADSITYDLASRTGGKVVTYVPTNHFSVYYNMPGRCITVATDFGNQTR
jgi:hypothetical protein